MRYAVDDPQRARDIVDFWQRGTASAVEKSLLDAIAHGDNQIRARLRMSFPVLVDAYERWRRGDK